MNPRIFKSNHQMPDDYSPAKPKSEIETPTYPNRFVLSTYQTQDQGAPGKVQRNQIS